MGEIVTGVTDVVDVQRVFNNTTTILGSDVVFMSSLIPGGRIGVGEGFLLNLSFSHPSGTSTITYKVNIGGVLTAILTAGNASQFNRTFVIVFMNDPGSQTSNAWIIVNGVGGFNVYLVPVFAQPNIDTRQDIVIQVTANSATSNVDLVAGKLLLINQIR